MAIQEKLEEVVDRLEAAYLQNNAPLNKLLELVTHNSATITEMKEDLAEVKIQTQKTNGRVNALETSKSLLEMQIAGVNDKIDSLRTRMKDDRTASEEKDKQFTDWTQWFIRSCITAFLTCLFLYLLYLGISSHIITLPH